MRVLLVAVAIAAASAAAACSAPAPAADGPPPQRAFYYWRTTFRLSPAEARALTELGVTRLYLRAFDVEWSAAEGAPSMIGKVAPLEGARVPAGIEVVPVVFLRDEVFRRARDVSGLARQVWAEVGRRMALFGVTARELQLDCDWTDTTQGAFFAFTTCTFS
jgi:hypothetical protein